VGKGQPNQGKIDLRTAERRYRALELRKAGMGYAEIAKQLGLSSPGNAYRIVKNALKATYREPADDVRKLELERLDRLTMALWKRAQNGEAEAIDRVLKLMDRRAKLLGLDAPEKTEHTGGITVEYVNDWRTPIQSADSLAGAIGDQAGRPAALPTPRAADREGAGPPV
jgi:hypothetical protein